MKYKCKLKFINNSWTEICPYIQLKLKYKKDKQFLYDELNLGYWSISDEEYQNNRNEITLEEYFLSKIIEINSLGKDKIMQIVKERIITTEGKSIKELDTLSQFNKEVKQLKNMFNEGFEIEI